MDTRESIIKYLSIFGAKIQVKDIDDNKLQVTVSGGGYDVTMDCNEFNLYRGLYGAALKVYLLDLVTRFNTEIVFEPVQRQYLRTIFNSYLKYRAASLIKGLDITAPRWSSVMLLQYPHFEFMYNILECETVKKQNVVQAIDLLFN